MQNQTTALSCRGLGLGISALFHVDGLLLFSKADASIFAALNRKLFPIAHQ
jgi:hypothetical protein